MDDDEANRQTAKLKKYREMVRQFGVVEARSKAAVVRYHAALAAFEGAGRPFGGPISDEFYAASHEHSAALRKHTEMLEAQIDFQKGSGFWPEPEPEPEPPSGKVINFKPRP